MTCGGRVATSHATTATMTTSTAAIYTIQFVSRAFMASSVSVESVERSVMTRSKVPQTATPCRTRPVAGARPPGQFPARNAPFPLSACAVPQPVDTAVFHICARAAIDAARAQGAYRADSLVHEGFVHLSRAHQVLPTARAYFGGVPDLVLLVIDPTLLTARLVYEPPAPLPTATPKPADADAELYPHCYGPIDLDAIVDVIELAHFGGAPVHADTMAVLRQYRFERLPVEGTLYRSTWRSTTSDPSGAPAGTAMLGCYTESPPSMSMFHRLTHDEVWHAYGGDPFRLHLLHADGRIEEIRMGHGLGAGEHVQYVIPAGTWQAGELVPGGRHALFGCTMAPGFTGDCFEAGRADMLLARYPAAADIITRLGVTHGTTRMPDGFAT